MAIDDFSVSQLDAAKILSALDDDQRAVALATRGPVCVIAGAGTGKTRAITHRIAYGAAIGVMDPHKVLALTFTARAAGRSACPRSSSAGRTRAPTRRTGSGWRASRRRRWRCCHW